MIRHKLSSTLISCLLLTAACSNAPPTGSVDPNQVAVSDSSEIRPGSKGQRLELTEIETELVIPAGTTSFAIQSQQFAIATQAPVLEWLMPSAQAQENDEEIESVGLDELEDLQITVDGETVEHEILSIEESAEGDLIVVYKLKNVPTSEENALIEFNSPSGRLQFSTIVERIDRSLPRPRVDIASTALAKALRKVKPDPRCLTRSDLERLARSETALDYRDAIYGHILEPGTRRFEDGVQRRLEQSNARIRDEFKGFIEGVSQCSARQPRPPRPAFPPEKTRPLPERLREKAQMRVIQQEQLHQRREQEQLRQVVDRITQALLNKPLLRARLGIRGSTANEIRSALLQRPELIRQLKERQGGEFERIQGFNQVDSKLEQKLRQVSPELRRQHCIRNQIVPCPGLDF